MFKYTKWEKTMCFNSCNVTMHIVCIHENVFRDAFSHDLFRTNVSPSFPDFHFFLCVCVTSLTGTSSLLKMEDSSIWCDHQDVSMNPRSMKENKTKQKNFHCWSVVFTFYMSVLFSHPPAELTASALKLQRSLFYISVLLLAASRRFVADWPGCFQGKGGYSGQWRWRGELWYLCTWWQEEEGGGGGI